MIHPAAIIHKNAKLGNDVSVGAGAVIGENVTIGEGSQIGNHCVIDGITSIGKNCKIFTGAVVGSIPQDLKYKGEKTSLKIGDNNIIREFCTINLGTIAHGQTLIGDSNLIMAYSHIAHDCIVGNNCVLANNATLAGHVTIMDRAVIGGIVAIHQFVRVGTLSMIGGCSKVVQDIPPYSTCDGHPAKVFGLNSVGLERSGVSRETRSNLKKAFKIIFNGGLSMPNAIKKVEDEIPASTEISHLLEFIKSSERGVSR